MSAKRLNSETSKEAPVDKRGRLADTNKDDFDAELDDEVEKELREFEELQSGLLGTTIEQENNKTGVENARLVLEKESIEKEHDSGSDMELDDMQHEIAGAKKKNSGAQQHASKAPNRGQPAVLEEAVPLSSIRILPDTFAEENLRGDDLVEKSGIPEDGEEACLDLKQLRLFEDSRAADPLLTPPQFSDPNMMASNCVKPNRNSRLEQSEVEQVRVTDQVTPGTPPPDPNSDDNSNDPDFPSPGKRKPRSRARFRSAISLHSESRKSPKKKQTTNNELPTISLKIERCDFYAPNFETQAKSSQPVMPPLTKTQTSPPSRPPLVKDTIQNPASQSHLHAKGSHQIEKPICAAPFVPKEAFVDPVLKVHTESQNQDPEFRDPIFDQVPNSKPTEQSGEKKILQKPLALGHHDRAIDFSQTEIQSNKKMQHVSPIHTTSKYQPEVVEPPIPRLKFPTTQGDQQIAPSPGPSNPKPPKHPAYLDFLQNSQDSANSAFCSEEHRKEELSTDWSGDSQSTKTPHDQLEYCVIERIIQRRFRNSFTLDSEKLDMMGADRPTILLPELHPYMKHYENQTWLAACNEMKKFFCWPCLFFASKVVWSVNCTELTETMILREINKHIKSPVHQESLKQLDIFTLKNNSNIIKKLVSNKFVSGTWTRKDREAIILKGRPRPVLDGMADPDFKTNQKIAFEKFYDEVKWICLCTSTRRFYCWPCLLFSKEKLWCYAGTIRSSEAEISQHETTQQHMATCLKLGKQEFDLRKKPECNKEEIEKTCSLLTSLVEILCAEKKKINNSEFSSMDFVDTLEMMSEYNGSLRVFIDGKSRNSKIAAAQVFMGAILDSVEFFIKGGILDEMKNSNFISLIFDHSSGLSNKAILSVIARYVDENGQVHERFVKLLNVGYNTPSNTLSDEFFQVITELECRSKLVGFTYDGYLVKPGDIPEFNGRVQKLCPNAKFFHYTEHSFKRVLKQTLCHVPICRMVLQTVKELAVFFEGTPGVRKGLLEIVAAAERAELDGVWRSSNFIVAVFMYHAVIVEVMESICKNSHAWKVKTVVQATNFLDFFNNSTNWFFVTLVGRIFSAVEDLSNVLYEEVRVEDLKTIASHTALKIQKLGRNFDNVVDSACSHLEASNQENTRKEMSALREEFSNVIRLVVKLVKNRIFGLETGYFKIFQETPSLSVTNFIKMNRQYLVLQNVSLPSNFNSTKLSNEIQFFHNTPIAGLDLSEIIARMINYNMAQVLPELFKFLQLALTIPKKEYESTIPAVRRISSYIEGKKDLNSTDALIWMEKEFLSNLQKEASFYQRVTDRVMSVTRKEVLEQFFK